jgi:hypothetical protein
MMMMLYCWPFDSTLAAGDDASFKALHWSGASVHKDDTKQQFGDEVRYYLELMI